MNINSPKYQQAAILLMSMMILMVLTGLGVTALTATLTERKIANNYADRVLAVESARSAIAQAQSWLRGDHTTANTRYFSVHPPATATCNTAPCDVWAPGSFDTPILKERSESWWNANAQSITINVGSNTIQPQYVIEQLPQGRETHAIDYRIVARAKVGNTVVLKSTIYRAFSAIMIVHHGSGSEVNAYYNGNASTLINYGIPTTGETPVIYSIIDNVKTGDRLTFYNTSPGNPGSSVRIIWNNKVYYSLPGGMSSLSSPQYMGNVHMGRDNRGTGSINWFSWTATPR